MADKRSEYVVEIGGLKHVFLLTEDDAKRYPNATKTSGAAKGLAEQAAAATKEASENLTKALVPDNK